MITFYTTKITLTPKKIVVETLANAEMFVDVIVRSVGENDALRAVIVRHKQQADEALGVDTPQEISARKNNDLKLGNTTSAYLEASMVDP